jgi:sphinganine-1-phosphate aldolase
MVPSGPGVERYTKLPAEGWSKERIMEEMERLAGMKHERWEDGRVSGAVYHGGKELRDLQTEAFGLFTVANPIHPEAFPGVRKMEAEVVAMVSISPFHSKPRKLTIIPYRSSTSSTHPPMQPA